MESIDLVVIGAGWCGLAAVKTYLEVNPSSNVALLEAASSVGGVWAKHRLYKGLKSNNMLGTYEYSDFPMDEATFGVKPGEHIPGHVLQKYFEKYTEHFKFQHCIRLNSRVESAEHRSDGSWVLTVVQTKQQQQQTSRIETKRLIVATGLTSQAYLPSFEGQESFGAPLFHCRDLLEHEPEVLKKDQHVTIFGGTKSSWDAAYACATSGMQVDWIIRESGHGPIWMAPPYVTPLKKWLEKLVTTRFLTWFSPCIWGDADGHGFIRRLLHGTWLGRKLVDAFWAVLAQDVIDANGYDKHPEVKKLQPWISPFWIASSLSILNYPTDFFDLVRDGSIRIHIADIDHLSPNTVHLSTGSSIPTTALICSTGWKATPPIKFLPTGIDKDLGFPWSPDLFDETLLKQADEEILRLYPRLRDQPVPNEKYKPLADTAEATAPHPFRLARFMVPPVPSMLKERSIAFMGITMTINTALIAQTQALWISAYFTDRLTLTPTVTCPSPITKAILASFDNKRKITSESESESGQPQRSADIIWETALQTEFGKFRYPGGFGRRNPDFVFDAIPYVDLLVHDLGLRSQRKASLIDWIEPYGVEDYRGLVDEWKSAHHISS
ncbi:hypothetical protein MPDQ_004569 [Monascus purpureus]|uniref:FAD/NAD(P)-binding domain-containing protein n=1 Tax=Monascus purpureus TaxID=5098 RepID=A0A507R6E9_MONPU|nr:hypothetical protein MPDQ_004569 [Monascus purpureus]